MRTSVHPLCCPRIVNGRCGHYLAWLADRRRVRRPLDDLPRGRQDPPGRRPHSTALRPTCKPPNGIQRQVRRNAATASLGARKMTSRKLAEILPRACLPAGIHNGDRLRASPLGSCRNSSRQRRSGVRRYPQDLSSISVSRESARWATSSSARTRMARSSSKPATGQTAPLQTCRHWCRRRSSTIATDGGGRTGSRRPPSSSRRCFCRPC